MKNLRKGNYFRTEGGLIGKINDIKLFQETTFIEVLSKGGRYFHFPLSEVKKCAEKIEDLFEYEDLLKVFDSVANGYFYYGFSENTFSNISSLIDGLLSDGSRKIVGIISKEKIKDSIFYTVENTCSEKNRDTCQKEKMGCEGCFYNLKK